MARELDQDELIERWTLIGDDLERVASKRSAAKLGFALLLKFFAAHGRFPRRRQLTASAAVEFVAKQLRVPASDLGFYDWSGRSIERHRAEIREALGFRECSVAEAAVDRPDETVRDVVFPVAGGEQTLRDVVAESSNRANAEIFYGKARDIASNRRDEQEMSVLCLHILQAAMVYVNTLMLQDVLAEDEWSQLLTGEDYRGLTPLTWAHVAMHGEFRPNMNSRLDLGHTSP